MGKKFIIPGQPETKQRPRFNRWGYKKAFTPTETKIHEHNVGYCFRKIHPGPPSESPVRKIVKAFYKIPKSYSKKKKAAALSGELKVKNKQDFDNVLKSIADGLNPLTISHTANTISCTAIGINKISTRLMLKGCNK